MLDEETGLSCNMHCFYGVALRGTWKTAQGLRYLSTSWSMFLVCYRRFLFYFLQVVDLFHGGGRDWILVSACTLMAWVGAYSEQVAKYYHGCEFFRYVLAIGKSYTLGIYTRQIQKTY